ncbi:MAG: hypothetical protein K1X68_06450 [Saprospiraceae bacterium]|nr:hypothetical protein [Saprospiraceae bacterium]HMW38319.1 hypothetical protein [Saprospiraceae bacterium]HMX88161.1 hypothetical protein [Saprospiraceae bacterium]HMZ39900.1 hypothetical protein [Saprospiraceae bacterium]HNA63983.1 hypothetical protein [Saprospiraceae bacterium]
MVNKTKINLSISIFAILLVGGIRDRLAAQTQAQSRIAIAGIDLVKDTSEFFISSGMSDYNSAAVLQQVPNACIEFFSNFKNFVAIDRKNLSLINMEKELQKSEEFIDGYIVDQGKSEGVDYMVKSLYYEKKKNLVIRIYDIAGGNVKCTKEQRLESNLLGIKNINNQTRLILHELVNECFGIKFTVLKGIEPAGSKLRHLTVVMGRKSKVKEEDQVEIFELVEENVEGEMLKRRNVIGTGTVEEVVDENFSNVKIESGEKVIAEAIAKGKKLYCTIINVYK